MPRRLIAALSIALRVAWGAADSVAWPAPAAPLLSLAPPVLSSETSCSTPAPFGISRPAAAAAAVKADGVTLTTIAFPAGAPRLRAVASETTAFTPPTPSVPNAATRSFFVVRPAAVTVPPSVILSSVPIVYETAIPPPATPRQSPFDTPVGRSASIRSVATTPGIRLTSAVSLGDSENGATMSRSAWTLRRSGATLGSAAATGAEPVEGRTEGRPNEGAAASAPTVTGWPEGAELSTATSAPLSVPTAARTQRAADSVFPRPPRLIDLAIRRPPSVRCTKATLPYELDVRPARQQSFTQRTCCCYRCQAGETAADVGRRRPRDQRPAGQQRNRVPGAQGGPGPQGGPGTQGGPGAEG